MTTTAVRVRNPKAEALLAKYEDVIEHGLASFVEVGQELLLIRQERLYRDAGYASFESYCTHRWHFGRVRAHQMMKGAALLTMVNAPAGVRPANERQARALGPLRGDPNLARQVLEAVQKQTGGKLTAATIAREVRRVHGEEPDPADKEAEKQFESMIAELTPPDFDPEQNAELIRQLGALSRLCDDLVKLGTPTEFAAAHTGTRYWDFTTDHRDRVRAAATWLRELLRILDGIHLDTPLETSYRIFGGRDAA